MAALKINSAGQAVGQVIAFVKGLSRRQKLLLSGGGAVVLVTLLVFVKLLGAPEMKPLYTGMTPSDAQLMATRLALHKIPYEISPDGSTISVPARRLDAARLEMAVEGGPRSGRMGFELFDKQNWASSDFSEKVNYQRALEGELERTIQTMDGVESVRVHLALPPDSVFSDSERDAKASVILSMRGGPISRQTENAIARLVAGAVDRLSSTDVAVIDADTDSAVAKIDTDGSDAEERSLEAVLSQRLVQTLEPVVGVGRVRASVRLEYDLTSSDEQEEKYDPNTSAPLSMQRTEEHGSTAGGGVAGTSSNLPGSSVPMKSSADNDISRSENGTYAVSKIVRHTVVPAGRIKRIAAAVLVDDDTEVKDEKGRVTEIRHHRSPEQMEQIEKLAKAAVGIDDSRGDVLTVQNMGFQQPFREKTPSLFRRVQGGMREWSQAIRLGSLALLFVAIYVAMLRPLKKQLVTALKATSTRMLGSGREDKANTVEAEVLAEGSPEIKQFGALKKQIVEKVKAEPGPATRLVQSWIREGNRG